MKIDKKITFSSLFIVLLIIYIEYAPSKFENYALPSKSVLSLNENILKSYAKEYITDRKLNKYWGFIEEKKLKAISDKNVTKTEKQKWVTEVNWEQKNHKLCIKQDCYRLLGIYKDQNGYFVTLYNKDLKEQVKDYNTNEILSSGILIEKISLHTVIFSDKNSTRTWEFKIFDVNQTKYRPKEIEE